MYDPLDFTAIGELIQKRRDDLKMSQYKLADKSGIPRSAVRRIEVGDPNAKLSDIYYICNALGLSVSDILPPKPQSSVSIAHLTDFLSKFNAPDQIRIIEGLTTMITTISPKIPSPEANSTELVLK